MFQRAFLLPEIFPAGGRRAQGSEERFLRGRLERNRLVHGPRAGSLAPDCARYRAEARARWRFAIDDADEYHWVSGA